MDLQPSQTSVIAQAARTETVKLPDGSSVIKILLTNTLANGTSVTKQFVQEPKNVLKEVENAKLSMELMRIGVATLAQGNWETMIVHEPSD